MSTAHFKPCPHARSAEGNRPQGAVPGACPRAGIVTRSRPERVSDAPLKEVIIDKNPSLYKELPLFRVNPMDGGFYLSKACVISRDPETGENQNLGMYRMQVKDHDRIGIQAAAQHDIAIHLRKAEELDIPLRVAIAVSNEPVTSLVASTPLHYRSRTSIR